MTGSKLIRLAVVASTQNNEVAVMSQDDSLKDFERFADFLFEAQASIIAAAEDAESASCVQPAKFLQEPWERTPPHGGRTSRGVTAVLEGGVLWEKAAASISVLYGHLSQERAESLSTDGVIYKEGEAYRACALSLVFHARSPLVPTLRGDVRLFQVPGRGDAWFGGGADLTPSYLFEEDAREFHKYWRDKCIELASSNLEGEPLAGMIGDRLYAEMKQLCDNYFFIPARKEHRGVGGIFFDRFQDATLWKVSGLCEKFAREVALGWMPCYLPIVHRRKALEVTEAMREWQLLRRGRYVEFNLLYDRGVKFGLSQLEKVMVSAPPLVAWRYSNSPASLPAADQKLLQVLAHPIEWAFPPEAEMIEFVHEGTSTVAGVLPRKTVLKLGCRFRGVGVLIIQEPLHELEDCRILCQQRSATKTTYPSLWDVLTGGTAKVGEVPKDTVCRELQEEVGISVDVSRLVHLQSCKVDTEIVHCHCEAFAYISPPGQSVKFEDGEVSQVAWLSATEVRKAVGERRHEWVEQGLQVWRKFEDAGGPEKILHEWLTRQQ